MYIVIAIVINISSPLHPFSLSPHFLGFISNINEALHSFASGLDLKQPDPKIYKAVELRPHKTHFGDEAKEHFESILTEWCNQIDQFMSQKERTDNDDVGPRAELEK